jgi:hypothetical protein
VGGVIVLDWRRDARVSPASRPCAVCAAPTLLICPTGLPCHKFCAEARITAYLTADPPRAA